MTITQIAEDIGRSEATIRNHLTGKTKAGQLIRQTYERFLREGIKIEIPSTKELEELKRKLEEEKKKIEILENTLKDVKESLKQLMEKLEKV
ncbi:MAG: transcriptional regulator, partial [Nitrososphaerota archaeon]